MEMSKSIVNVGLGQCLSNVIYCSDVAFTNSSRCINYINLLIAKSTSQENKCITRLSLRCILRQCKERSEEHTSKLQSLMRISYAVFCLKKNNNPEHRQPHIDSTEKQHDRTRI